jgi:hypothetical protein
MPGRLLVGVAALGVVGRGPDLRESFFRRHDRDRVGVVMGDFAWSHLGTGRPPPGQCLCYGAMRACAPESLEVLVPRLPA